MKLVWRNNIHLVPYDEALKEMERIVDCIISGESNHTIWFLEHPDIYTSGSSAKPESLLDSKKFPVYHTGRGGDYTYHGPGQRIVYFMLDLKKIFAPNLPDLKQYIYKLEQVIIETLQDLGIESDRRDGRIGVWVETISGEKKIAAIGVRVRKWVSYHGIAINIKPNLDNFRGIIPCGISEYGVTSLQELGKDVEFEDFDEIMKSKIKKVFGV